MIGIAIALMQAAAPASVAPPPAVSPAVPPAETLRATPPVLATPRRVAIDPDQAVALFKVVCPAHLRDEAGFMAAVTASGLAFVPAPRRETTPGQTLRADRALLNRGTGRDGAMRCTLLGRTAGVVDQLSLSARLATALNLKPGRTRAGKDQAVTEWTVVDPDGKPVQISAATRNAAGGGTDLRLSAAMGR